MLTKECRDVLNHLRILTSNSESEISFLGDTTCFCLSDDIDIVYNYKKYQSEITGIIAQLESEKYITYTRNKYHFQLTQLAIHENQFVLSEVFLYIKDKLIDIFALIISIIALLKSYGYDVLSPILILSKQLLELLWR